MRPRVSTRAVALPRPWPVSWDWSLIDGRGWIGRNLTREVEQRRLFPWIAVAFGLGIVLFFQADQPSLWAPLSATGLCCVAAFLLRGNFGALIVLTGLAALFAGFSAGALRTGSVAAPVLPRIVIAPLGGFIEAVEEREDGKRLLLRVVELDAVAEAERPGLVRVSVRQGEGLRAGQYVTGMARLLPPPEPAWPGGYDFARDAFYKGIGAVGSFSGAVRPRDPPREPPLSLKAAAGIDEARNALTQRIATAIGGAAGGVGAALVTGKRGLIDEATNDVLRAAGIYHIVSISGLHMVLAAGTFFWLARATMSLAPMLVLLWPVKKIAAVAAMIGASVYCVFSGSDVATVRSLAMTLVMFGAVLVDRPALSIRNLSIAAIIVLAREPEALLGPSFQMSFGAVAAMMALVPLLQWRKPDGAPDTPRGRIMRWIGQSVLGLFTTTLVASLATAPFSAYHFQSLNPYGLLGNALALPLVSLVVMPSAVLGVLAYPFGLDRPLWQIMGLAVAKVLEVSAWVGGFSGSTLVVPALSAGALALLGLALLTLTLPASSLRLFALLPAGAGLALTAAPDRFDVYIDREGAGAAIRSMRGQLTFVGKPSSFVMEQWLRADGDGRSVDDASLRQDARCDRLGCIVEAGAGRAVAFVQDPAAFEEDCWRTAVVISRLAAPGACHAPLVLDRTALAARGATAIRLGRERIEIRSVRKGTEIVILKDEGGRKSGVDPSAASIQKERPRPARPVPEQDYPEGEISTGEPD